MASRPSWLFALLALSAALGRPAPLAAPQGAPDAPQAGATPDDDSAARLEELLDEYDRRMQAFRAKLAAAEDDAARRALYDTDYPDDAAFAERMRALALAAPEHEAALSAVLWIFQRYQVGEHRGEYLALAAAHHLNADGVSKLCASLADDPRAESEGFLRRVLADSESRVARGHASFALAGSLARRARLAEQLPTWDDLDRQAWGAEYGAATLARIAETDVAAANVERRALLVRARDEFADVPYGRGTLGKAAAGQLFELEHLQVGMTAPEIAGADLDGVEFKLGDYRGQVVFLDFWGDW